MSIQKKQFAGIIIGLMVVVLIQSESFGQFEQKLTMNASGTITYPDMFEENTSFGMGYGFEGGLMFNLNRRVSVFGNARFYYMFGLQSYDDAYYDNLAFGGGIKLNLIPSKKINPYLYAEASLNFIWFEEFIPSTGDGYYSREFGTSIGGLGGVGLDIKINDHLAVFLQTAPYYTFWDGRINLYSQAGFRINMIKSKTI